MDTVKEFIYKGYKIEIHPQPKTGDNTKLFLGVWKNDEKVFSIWVQISGTNSRSIGKDGIFDLLEKKGMNKIKQMIENQDFEVGKEYKFWESNN